MRVGLSAVIVIPQHHGNWNPPATSPAAGYDEPWKQRMEQIPADRRPALRFVVEATRAAPFDIKPSQWAGPAAGTLIPLGGPGCYKGDR